MTLIYLLSAIAIGMAFATQPAINGAAIKYLGSPVAAAAVSVVITLAACLAMLPFMGGTLRPAAVLSLPWWVVFGGLIGAFVVAGGAAIAPVTGAALFFVCLISGQLIGSVLVDHFGAFGMTAQPVSLTKLAGVALALGGVVLVRIG